MAANGELDYTAIAGGDLMQTFTAGEATKSFTIALANDPVVEGTEYFTVTLALTTDATTMASGSASGDSAFVFIVDTSGKRQSSLCSNFLT